MITMTMDMSASMSLWVSKTSNLLCWFIFCLTLAIYMPKSADERGKEPNWADNTREMFREFLDTNKNGL